MSSAQTHEDRFAQWASIASDGDFEQSMTALEDSVALLEDGGLSLAAMTECYELGLRLSRRCTDLLRDAELRISFLEQSFAESESAEEIPSASRLFTIDE